MPTTHLQLAKPTPEYLAELQARQTELRYIVTDLRALHATFDRIRENTPDVITEIAALTTAAIDTLNERLLHLDIIERGLLAMGVTLTEPEIFNKAFRSHEDFVHHGRSSLSVEEYKALMGALMYKSQLNLGERTSWKTSN